MIKSFSKYALLLIIGAFIVSGCAKHEMVKKDEVVPPATNAKPAEMPTAKSALQEVGIKEQPVKEARLKEQVMKESRADTQMGASLERIFFDFDSSLLTPAARGTLAKNAEMIKKKVGTKIQIEGHCDERGSDEYNVALGEKRARSAMQYLVTMGVPADKLAVISYGEEKPADSGHNEAAWAKNRRDEFVVRSK